MSKSEVEQYQLRTTPLPSDTDLPLRSLWMRQYAIAMQKRCASFFQEALRFRCFDLLGLEA
jgi:hypothetical protein